MDPHWRRAGVPEGSGSAQVIWSLDSDTLPEWVYYLFWHLSNGQAVIGDFCKTPQCSAAHLALRHRGSAKVGW